MQAGNQTTKVGEAMKAGDIKQEGGKMKAKLMKIGTLTEKQRLIGLRMVSGGYRQYSAKAAQTDLDLLTPKGTYTLDGDTYHGYLVRHNATNKTVCHGYSPRELVILTVELFETAEEE